MAKPKRPRDTNQLAAMIVGLSTGEAQELDPDAGKDPAAVALGRRGGLKGGKARAAKLSAERLSQIGKKGAAARAATKKATVPISAVPSQPKRPKKKRLPVIQVHED